MPEITEPQLTESEVERMGQRVENNQPLRLYLAEFDLDVGALIRDWRALRAENEQLKAGRQKMRDDLRSQRTHITHWQRHNARVAAIIQCDAMDESVEAAATALREQLAQANQHRGLVVISALINFVDWLATQGVLVTNVPESRAVKLRGELVREFLAAHSEGESYFSQADEIAERLGEPFKDAKP